MLFFIFMMQVCRFTDVSHVFYLFWNVFYTSEHEFRDDRSFLESSKYFVIRKKKENSSSLFQLLHITDSSPSWDFSLKRCNPEISRVVGTDTPNIKSPNLGFGFWRQNTRFPAKTCKWHYLWFVNFGFNNVNGV